MILEEMEVHQQRRSKIRREIHHVPPVSLSSTRGSSHDHSNNRDNSNNGNSNGDGNNFNNGNSGNSNGDGNNSNNGNNGSGGMATSCGMGGSNGMGGSGGMGGLCKGGGSGGNNGMPRNCRTYVIFDNDPRVHYTGPWTLKASQPCTVHSTVVEGSTASLRFNGKF